MTSRPIDSKREEFRKYLERAGVMDALTKVLVMLYEEPEKPEDALDYVRINLGDKRPGVAEIEAMKSDLESALARIQSLEAENEELKNKLNQMEGNEGVDAAGNERVLAEGQNTNPEQGEMLKEDLPLPKRESTTAEERPAAPVAVE